MSDGWSDEVKAFWEARAREYGIDQAATLEDLYLRRLEIETMRKRLRRLRPRTVLDVGCGNGYSTISLAASFPQARFVGIDYSEEMIRQARTADPTGDFRSADVLEPSTLPAGPWDVVYTQRCIQNILDPALQDAAIRNLIDLLPSGGVLLLMECSKDGLEDFNALRRRVSEQGPFKKEPFHNLWIEDDRMRENFDAEIDHFCSTYMLGKAIHPWLQQVLARLPQIGRFGYEKLYVIRSQRS